jgi:hypothetical protein
MVRQKDGVSRAAELPDALLLLLNLPRCVLDLLDGRKLVTCCQRVV